MKNILLLIAALILADSSSLLSQIVITKADFPMQNSYESNSYGSAPTDFKAPAVGENQSWDLSNLDIQDEYGNEFFDASNDDYYTEAINYINTQYYLNEFIIESKDFYTLDDQGHARIGRRITEEEFSIAQVTGGANDKLKVIGGNFPFEGRLDFIKFPLEYEDTWTQSHDISTFYELTVESYGLKDTPGLLIQNQTQTRTVVGSGELTMPNKDGGVMTIDALLIKVEMTVIDSVFLGGLPGPPPLLAAFGLEQGRSRSNESYVYYSPGYGESVASSSAQGEQISYKSLSGLTTSVETEELNKLSVYPNPVKIGSILNIADSKVKLTNIELVDQSGKVVLENEMSGNASLSIPNTITAGAYLLNSYDSNGKIVSSNKIIIE